MSSLQLELDINSASSIDSNATATPYNTPIPKGHSTITNINVSISPKYSAEETMKNAGYSVLQKIDETLQGSVYKVSHGQHIKIIKVTSKSLHKHGVTYIDGEAIQISEDIIKEKTILKYLSTYNPPSSLAQYTEFFSDKFNYFLVTEFGGPMTLFEFVQKCHTYIEEGLVSIDEWQKVCKLVLKQMVDLLDWMHNEMHCCHLDLSLENFVIDNVQVTQHEQLNKITFRSDFQIKIIDFGVAEVFIERNKENEIDFQCNKYVGKQFYKAPEVYSKKVFDARAADCWSLAVVFFMMVSGCTPFNKPSMSDAAYKAIMSGYLSDLLFQWKRLDYCTHDMLNLMNCLFQTEKYRVTIKDLKMHPFLL